MSKVWFVTGSSRGLGRQFVEAALSRGDRVAATARTITGLDDLVDRYGDAVLPLELDVTGRKAVFETVEQAKKHFGRLDVIVNNAGYAQFGAVEELTEQELRDQLETNLFGAVWVIQAALPYLREQRSGHIVQLSSAAGIITMPLGGADRPGLRRRPPAARRDDRQAAPGDPAAAARALLKLVDSDDPPLRVIFGVGIYPMIQQVYAGRLKTWDDWQELSAASHG